MSPPICVFTLDCLRASTCTAEITPFLRSFPIRWNRCYSSGTWTLPSHASLYSGLSPNEHGITRPANLCSKDDANLMRVAKESGYDTAIFSENPTFSSQTGFGHYVDETHDDIHRKFLQSEFSPFGYVERIDAAQGIALTKKILSRSNRCRNAINAGYAGYLRILDRTPRYPHHGKRVLSHFMSYLSEKSVPTLTVTNILEPHNPYHGVPPNMSTSRPGHELEALRGGDDNREYLLTEEEPPEPIRDTYGNWDEFFNAQERVYEEYATQADQLLKRWSTTQPDCFEDALVVVLGDHGQLFGAGGMVGHHTSLHPHGVNVPLAIDPPSDWENSKQIIETPVSIDGIGQTLMEVASGNIEMSSHLTEAIADNSRSSDGAVLACADGPVWSIPSLYENERFDDDLIQRLAVRKVARIHEDCVDLYQSQWDDGDMEAASYTYSQDNREVNSGRETPPAPDDIEEWVTQTYRLDSEQRDSVDTQLEDLGYV